MKLQNVLAAIRSAETEKTAEVSPVEQPKMSKTEDALKDKLAGALSEVEAAASNQKVAEATGPVKDLEKIANQVISAEQEALMKEAQMYGAYVADGFMLRLAQYNEIAETLPRQKAASVEAPSLDKFAAANPELTKEALALGYNTTMGQMDKLAEAAYQKGYEEATELIYKLASASFTEGYNRCAELL